MDPFNDNQFKSLLSDNKSGSVELLNQLNRWLKFNIGKAENSDLIVQKIKSSLSHFQTIDTYLAKLQNHLKEEDYNRLSEFFDQTEYEMQNVHNKIFENGLPYFTEVNKIMTFSNSYSVAHFIINLNNHKSFDEVIISESRPVMEGRQLAEKFIENGIVVRYILDAAAANYLVGVGAAIIGADKILKDGSIINKTGSRQLAILCKSFKIPFYVIADKSKISNTDKFEQEEKPAEEIWDFRHKNLKIENFYFEKIDKALITKIISD